MVNAQAVLKANFVKEMAAECLKVESKEISTAQENFSGREGEDEAQ